MVNHIVYLTKLHKAEINKVIKNRNFHLKSYYSQLYNIAYLNCDIRYYLRYIEKKIDLYNTKNEDKMTFDNCVIDYIKPIGSFNLGDPDNFLDLTNYKNTQPIFSSNKNYIWTDEDDTYWEKNIKDKEYFELYIPNEKIVYL